MERSVEQKRGPVGLVGLWHKVCKDMCVRGSRLDMLQSWVIVGYFFLNCLSSFLIRSHVCRRHVFTGRALQ